MDRELFYLFLFIWRNVRVSKLFYFSLQNIIKERVLTIMTKYIFVTGGVVSSIGKGIVAASLGRLLKIVD